MGEWEVDQNWYGKICTFLRLPVKANSYRWCARGGPGDAGGSIGLVAGFHF